MSIELDSEDMRKDDFFWCCLNKAGVKAPFGKIQRRSHMDSEVIVIITTGQKGVQSHIGGQEFKDTYVPYPIFPRLPDRNAVLFY